MPFLVLDQDYESRILAQVKHSADPDGALRQITFDITLPLLHNPPEETLPCHEPVEETAAVSAHISARIHACYEKLAAQLYGPAIPEAGSPCGISLTLSVEPQSFDRPLFCGHREYHSRRLQLQNSSNLPDLPFVSCLTVQSRPDYRGDWESYGIRPLSPLLPLQCLVYLPAVEALKIPWMWERPMPCCMPSRVMRDHYTRPWEGPLRDARHEFGAAILDPETHLGGRRIPASLTKAALHFWTPQQIPQEDQTVPRPNLIYPADRDPVSLGLCKLAAQLQILDVRALVTENLFPAPQAPAQEQWSKMKRLRIDFHPLRPDGRWYFVGPRGEDPHDSQNGGFKISESEHYPPEHDTEEDGELDNEWEDDPNGGEEVNLLPDLFRTEPCRDRIEPLLAAFAKALTGKRMPDLEIAELFSYLWWNPSESRANEYGMDTSSGIDTRTYQWGVKYVAGQGEKDSSAVSSKVQWQVGDWRPSREVMSLFEGLGQQEWLEFDVGHGRNLGDFDMKLRGCLF